MPAFVAVTAWYLIVGSVLMVGQYYLERYFGRGFGHRKPRQEGTGRLARPAGRNGRCLMSDVSTSEQVT